MKRFLAFVSALVTAATALCACQPKLRRYSAVYTDVFDTLSQFTAYCRSESEFEKASEAVHGELLRLHRLFDIYNPDGGLYKLNKDKKLIGADEDIIELLTLGKEYYNLSDGRLNIAMGSVLRLWHGAKESSALPDYSALTDASRHTDINNVRIDGDDIYLDDDMLYLDVGAIAKGYACEKAAEVAVNLGLESFALDLGGNIKAAGEKPDGSWKIGIKDPDGGIFTAVSVKNGMSVVTSGDYERFFELEGVRYSHIIDPETLYPADIYRSVTVVIPNSADGDAASTALFCMDPESGKKLAESLGAEVLWIYPDGRAERTGGFLDYES